MTGATSGLGVPDPATVADRLAIADVVHAYAAAVDQQDWVGAIAVFTEDALLDYTGSGGPVGTRTEVVEWIRDSLGPLGTCQHSVTNLVVTVEGDQALATSLLLNPLQLRPDADTQPGLLVGGSYRDRLRRTPDGWRIFARLQATAWHADLPMRAAGGP